RSRSEAFEYTNMRHPKRRQWGLLQEVCHCPDPPEGGPVERWVHVAMPYKLEGRSFDGLNQLSATPGPGVSQATVYGPKPRSERYWQWRQSPATDDRTVRLKWEPPVRCRQIEMSTGAKHPVDLTHRGVDV